MGCTLQLATELNFLKGYATAVNRVQRLSRKLPKSEIASCKHCKGPGKRREKGGHADEDPVAAG